MPAAIKTKILEVSLFIIFTMFWTNAAFALPRDFHCYMSPSEVQFQLVDPAGNVTGYDPTTGTVVNNIPNTHYFMDQEPTGPIEPTKYQKIMVIRPTLISSATTVATGTYTIKVFGSVLPEAFHFTMRLYYHGFMGPQVFGEASGTVIPNTTLTYQMTVPLVPPPGGQIPMVLIASSSSVPALPPVPQTPPATVPQNPSTPGNAGNQNTTNNGLMAATLIDHITANGQSGRIGGPRYVDELVKKVNEIEKDLTESQEKQDSSRKVVEKYQKLLKEITEKYQKPEPDEFVKAGAYTVLKEDLEYIISHTQ